jgi:membrane-bound lytic murein transglycosylase B
MLLPALLLFALSASPVPAADRSHRTTKAAPSGYDKRTEVLRFMDELVERHGFVREELQTLFRKVNFQPAVIKSITPPRDPGAKSWRNYRAIFVNDQRIGAGQRFLAQHEETLARASREFGVPREIIVAIIGVETVYGRNLGSYRVVDALSTLAFDYAPRSAFFRSELEHYLLFAREAGMDVFSLRGSFAGAFGLPQFMPSSYRRFAVDYDGDARANLVSSPADAIGSVGNFLKAHGWRRDAPIAFAAQLQGPADKTIAHGGVKPDRPVSALEAAGIRIAAPPGTLAPDTQCVLVELETPGQPSEYRAGLENFFVITRYNRSSFYAAAVMDLAEAIRLAGPASDGTAVAPAVAPAPTP